MADPVIAGSVTIDEDGGASGDGVALQMFQARSAARDVVYAAMPSFGFPNATRPTNDRTWAVGVAAECNELAPLWIATIQAMIDA